MEEQDHAQQVDLVKASLLSTHSPDVYPTHPRRHLFGVPLVTPIQPDQADPPVVA